MCLLSLRQRFEGHLRDPLSRPRRLVSFCRRSRGCVDHREYIVYSEIAFAVVRTWHSAADGQQCQRHAEASLYRAKACRHRRLPFGRLVHESSSDRQVLLFSATWPRYVESRDLRLQVLPGAAHLLRRIDSMERRRRRWRPVALSAFLIAPPCVCSPVQESSERISHWHLFDEDLIVPPGRGTSRPSPSSFAWSCPPSSSRSSSPTSY